MIELKSGDRVSLANAGYVTVIKELGRGGQGIVYLVDLNGELKALKWYLNPPGEAFYKNLLNNIRAGAPSEAFLWPEFVTARQKGSYGYVMALRPKNYYEFGNFLLAKVTFKSFTAMLAAAMKICNGFMMLHRFGYSYQDLNDGNFFINPYTGDVLICDNDNVMPEGERSGILGKARYMAPEIVGGKMPNKYSDRFSLSVILFMLFYANHPFEGAKVVSCPCMTEAFEKRFYGSEATFIFDPNDRSNRPVKGIHQNVIKRWGVFPAKLREVFTEQFSQEKLKNPQTRLIESQWEKVIAGIRDELVVCPFCKEETFVEIEGDDHRCINCGRSIDVSKYLLIGTRKQVLTKGTKLYIDHDNLPDCQVVENTNDGKLLIKNISPEIWTVETPSGKVKSVNPNEFCPIKNGLVISFIGGNKGQIVEE